MITCLQGYFEVVAGQWEAQTTLKSTEYSEYLFYYQYVHMSRDLYPNIHQIDAKKFITTEIYRYIYHILIHFIHPLIAALHPIIIPSDLVLSHRFVANPKRLEEIPRALLREKIPWDPFPPRWNVKPSIWGCSKSCLGYATWKLIKLNMKPTIELMSVKNGEDITSHNSQLSAHHPAKQNKCPSYCNATGIVENWPSRAWTIFVVSKIDY